jgi:hypothetical protein
MFTSRLNHSGDVTVTVASAATASVPSVQTTDVAEEVVHSDVVMSGLACPS